MSANWLIRLLSDHALNEAIRDLQRNRQWAERLSQLLREKSRREKYGIKQNQETLKI